MVLSTKQKKAAQQKNDSRKQKTFDKKLVIKAKRQKNPLAPFEEFHKYENDDGQFKISCKRSVEVDPEMWEWLFGLEEKNMKKMYTESEWGWDFEKKKQEMTDVSAYYLIATSAKGEPVAFSHFRFDMDYGEPVLYCYEIQLEANVRRLGLGKFIMNVLERIGFANKMEKVILTVFKKNDEALKFFYALGFKLDETSPDEDERKCYVILSKPKTDPTDEKV
ncbi:N-alpha-acetyltransferase 40 [Nilaparvata lugens]|uniref:N-alpha-acetyltransferase 40 n=1 Tax=Nilaparvata lugens TaxID=108931 RepID=UPI00193DABD0|nr:N-alpha-acetyltransferase 40 [Nilaparvata lugens]XP_039289480.1 N-alpha-acetyltransferase 40 [Nilaparvata lugens]XP_039289490.1 N-alpha-acetyltransferase 40 [Nilaparvata lugens]XP_039289497.1 N-alpha-acetyltransferase 40 [Nilaparvata lugens]